MPLPQLVSSGKAPLIPYTDLARLFSYFPTVLGSFSLVSITIQNWFVYTSFSLEQTSWCQDYVVSVWGLRHNARQTVCTHPYWLNKWLIQLKNNLVMFLAYFFFKISKLTQIWSINQKATTTTIYSKSKNYLLFHLGPVLLKHHKSRHSMHC